jgi:hypothetical protein
MRYVLSSFFLLSLATAGCSVANGPDDPQNNTSSPASTAASGGGEGGSGGGSGGANAGGNGGSGGSVMPICGDGTVNGDEECDGGGMETADCNADCTASSCGDNKVNRAAMEECDNGTSGDAACSKDCKALAFDIDGNTKAVSLGILFLRSQVGLTTTGTPGEEAFLVANLRFTSVSPTTSVIQARRYSPSGAAAKNLLVLTNSKVNPQVFKMATNSEGRGIVLIGGEDQSLRYRMLAAGGTPEGTQDQAVLSKQSAVQLDSLPMVAAGANNDFCSFYVDDNSQTGKTRAISAQGNFSATINDLGAIGAGNASLLGGIALGASSSGFVAGYVQPDFELLKLNATCQPQGNPVDIFNATGQTQGGIDSIAGSPNDEIVFAAGNVKGKFLQATEETRSVVQRVNMGTSKTGSVELTGSTHVEEAFGTIIRHPKGGEAIVAWNRQNTASQNNACELLLRRLDGDGKPTGTLITVPLEKNESCALFPAGAANSDGDVMITYSEYDSENSSQIPGKVRGIIYRRLLAPPVAQ